jgi:hypothetical protein
MYGAIFGIPESRLVSEMDARLEHLAHGDRHELHLL